jgi:CRISPR-associated protein Csb2
MLALALHYLNGWAVAAADGAKKETAEWPPHPDRVFMALAAAYFETDDGDKAAERAVLEWLECLPPPGLVASEREERRVVTHFVPVNDPGMSGKKKIAELAQAANPSLGALKDAGLSQLPEFRSRQPRSFPLAIPHHPIAHLVWPDADPTTEQRAALADLCRKVTHVGHSASLVWAWIDEAGQTPTWVPRETFAGLRLRVPSQGRLAYLTARCGREQAIRWADLYGGVEDLKRRIKATTGPAKKALKAEQARQEDVMTQEFPEGAPVPALDPKLFRPEPGRWQGYGKPDTAATATSPGTVFDPNLVVLRLSGHRLSLPTTLKLMTALRNLVMRHCPVQPPPEWLSGHSPVGKASPTPHLAFLPLPFVADPHADGRIMGVALALPNTDHLNAEEAAHCLGGLLRDDDGQPRPHHLFDGQWFDCTAELEPRSPPPQKSLDTAVWTAPSRRWATVTPVVLDRHFDGKDKWEQAAESVKTACERIGLPRPSEVLLHPVSMCQGVPRSNDFPAITRKSDGGRMHHSHAVLVFDEPVAGPVLVGAGRFRGYGLCRPLAQGGQDD